MSHTEASEIVRDLLDTLHDRWIDPGFPDLPADVATYNVFKLEDVPAAYLSPLVQLLDLAFGLASGFAAEAAGLASDDPATILAAVDDLDLPEARAIAAMDAFRRRAERLCAPRCEECGTQEGELGRFVGTDTVICDRCRDKFIDELVAEGLLESRVDNEGVRHYRLTEKGLRRGPTLSAEDEATEEQDGGEC